MRWLAVLLAALVVGIGSDVTHADPPAMLFPGKAWAEARPQDVGVNPQRLAEAMEFLRRASGSQGVTQALVVRYGRVIWKGTDVDNRHNVWSVTKSFTSTALGLLIADGKCSLDTPAAQPLPELQKNYPDVTLRHFASMTSGYDAVGGEASETPFVPAKPLFPPGAWWAYWDAAENELALALTRTANQPLAVLLKARVMDPIGATNWSWGDWGVVRGLLINGGAGNRRRGIAISASDMARFGLLFLNRGAWDGKPLVPAEWVEAVSKPSQPYLPAYGLNWWRNDGDVWPDAPPDTYAALGYNNNSCWIIPSLGLVVARLGVDGSPDDEEAVRNEFLKRVRWAAPPVDAGSLSGVLRDAADEPLAGASVRLVRGETLWASASAGYSGFYDLPNLPPGDYDLRVVAAGYAPAVLAVTVEPKAHRIADARLTLLGAVAGRVTRGGEPVAGAAVIAARGATEVAMAVTDSSGAYLLAGLPPGEPGFTVRVAGAAAAAVASTFRAADAVVVEPGRTLARDVALPDDLPGSLSGTATDAGGQPARGLEVCLLDADASIVTSALTGADGGYSLPLVAPGDYTLTAAGDGGDPASVPVTVAAGSDLVQPLALAGAATPSEPGSISGDVVSGDGAGVHGARVEALARGRVRAAALAGASGHFVLPGLAARDDYTVRVSGVGLQAAIRGKVKVARSANTPVGALKMAFYRPGSIQGRVVDAGSTSGRPLTGARVTLLQGDAVAGQTQTAWDGSYRLGGVAPGAYTIRLTRPGFAPAFLPAVVAPGGAVTADAGLYALASLSGSVARGDAPVADAQVRLLDEGGVERARVFTDAAGRWTIPAMLPAAGSKYRLEASATGLKSQTLSGIALKLDQENGPFAFTLAPDGP